MWSVRSIDRVSHRDPAPSKGKVSASQARAANRPAGAIVLAPYLDLSPEQAARDGA